MKRKKLYAALMVTILLVACLSGCSSGAGAISTYTIALSTMPQNFDAQVAEKPEEILVLTNIYDGLFEYVDGKIENNLAQNHSVSDDGLTYTFKLKNTGKFYVKKGEDIPVTAQDFAFSFKRILDKDTRSPYYDDFKNIVGIETPDDYTLILKLKMPDQNFLNKLCITAATPCNEDFFVSTKGAYGLGTKNILSNGPFSVNYLADDGSYATIVRTREQKNAIERIRLSLLQEGMTQENLYRDEKTSGFFEPTGAIKDLDGTQNIFQASNIHLEFNIQRVEMSNENIRKALAYYAFGMENSEANLDRISQSDGIFTDTTTYNGGFINELIQPKTPSYMTAHQAKTHYQRGLNELSITKLEGYSILIPSDSLYSVVFENVNQLWQKELGAFFTLEFLPMAEILQRTENNQYDIAFVAYTPKINSVFTVIERYAMYDSDINILLNTMYKKSSDSAINEIEKAQNLILEKAYGVPMCKSSSGYWHRKFFDNIKINPFGNIINLKYAKVK